MRSGKQKFTTTDRSLEPKIKAQILQFMHNKNLQKNKSKGLDSYPRLEAPPMLSLNVFATDPSVGSNRRGPHEDNQQEPRRDLLDPPWP